MRYKPCELGVGESPKRPQFFWGGGGGVGMVFGAGLRMGEGRIYYCFNDKLSHIIPKRMMINIYFNADGPTFFTITQM